MGGRKGQFLRRRWEPVETLSSTALASQGPAGANPTHLPEQAPTRVVPNGDDVALRVRAPVLDDVGHVRGRVRGRRSGCGCGWRGRSGSGRRRRDEAHLLLRDGSHGSARRGDGGEGGRAGARAQEGSG